MAANTDTFKEEPKLVSAEDRLQALILSVMNEERAEVCSPDQQALRKFFEMNAALLKRIAE